MYTTAEGCPLTGKSQIQLKIFRQFDVDVVSVAEHYQRKDTAETKY
jgi:hypothetical protein